VNLVADSSSLDSVAGLELDTAAGRCPLKRSKRRTLSISVLPDGKVEIAAPLAASLEAIQRKIEKRAGWIARQRRFFAALRVERPSHRYRTGATHRYLGRQYRLKVMKAPEAGVKLVGAYLHVSSPSVKPKDIESLVTDWMREKAGDQFARRLAKWKRWCEQLGLPEPRLVLRNMPKRWGSAHRDGRIFLNPELVRTPSPCIDYVIAHEICHLKHPGHDRAFYVELETLCPKWRTIKQRLESVDL
jgi:predicted metal-dependent hydrolase